MNNNVFKACVKHIILVAVLAEHKLNSQIIFSFLYSHLKSSHHVLISHVIHCQTVGCQECFRFIFSIPHSLLAQSGTILWFLYERSKCFVVLIIRIDPWLDHRIYTYHCFYKPMFIAVCCWHASFCQVIILIQLYFGLKLIHNDRN